MNPTDYDKMVDKLLQFRGKIPQYGAVNDRLAKSAIYELNKKIDEPPVWEKLSEDTARHACKIEPPLHRIAHQQISGLHQTRAHFVRSSYAV